MRLRWIQYSQRHRARPLRSCGRGSFRRFTSSHAGGNNLGSVDADHGAGTHTLSAQDLQGMADDPDDFKRQLQVLAASSGGAPGQAIITVDGF